MYRRARKQLIQFKKSAKPKVNKKRQKKENKEYYIEKKTELTNKLMLLIYLINCAISFTIKVFSFMFYLA